MPALALQFSQMLLLQPCRSDCLRTHHPAKFAQHLCIDAIGLGQNSSRSRKLPYPVGLDQADFDSRPRKPLDQSAFVPSARFTNHLHWRFELFNPLDQLAMTNGVIRGPMVSLEKRRFLFPIAAS